MKYVKTFRANNVAELEDAEIREKEYLHQSTEYNEAGNPIEAITYNPDGSVEHVYKYQYKARPPETKYFFVGKAHEHT